MVKALHDIPNVKNANDSRKATFAPLAGEGLRAIALQCLLIADAQEKTRVVRAIDPNALAIGDNPIRAQDQPLPGRSGKPVLVSPHRVPQRSLVSVKGRAALIHALAHIELNAVNLALDIVWRFQGLPDAFYREWMRVAREEAEHFQLLEAHLATFGHHYGDFQAHNGLWDMAERTRDDVLARLAIVPRILEARGLDVSPAIRDRLLAVGDSRGAEILGRILVDEIGHVAIGNFWFRALCKERDLDPESHARKLMQLHEVPLPRGPINVEARRRAGFDESEIAALCDSVADRNSGNANNPEFAK